MATQEELNKIYKEELGRGVDRSGAQTYAGMSADQVRKVLRSSQEYKNKKGGAKEEQKVSGSAGGGRINKDSLNRLTMEILGRNATAAEINHYTSSQNLSESFVAQELALSSKARERGVDPTQYGAKQIDPNSLSEDQKKYYNVWKKIHPNRAFYSTDLQALKWRQSAGSAEAYEQSRLGNIREVRGEDGSKQIVINQKAIQSLGPDLSSHLKGNEKGWTVLSAGSYRNKDGTTTAVTFGKNFGKASELKDKEGKPYQGLEGYVGTVTTGNQKDNSIVGELTELTGSEDLAKALTVAVMPFTAPTVYGSDQLQFLADPFGTYSGIVSKEAGESITRGGAKLTGLEEKDIAVAQQVGQVAISIVNPAAGAAMSMAKAASNYGMGYTSFGDAIVDIGVASVAFIPGAGALGSLGASFAGEMIKGAEFQDAAKNAAWSAAGSSTFGLSNLARAYTDDQFAKNPDGSINWLQVGLSSAPQIAAGFQTYRTAQVDGQQVSYSPFSSVSDYGAAVSQKLGSYNPMNTANFYSRQTGAAGINMQRFLQDKEGNIVLDENTNKPIANPSYIGNIETDDVNFQRLEPSTQKTVLQARSAARNWEMNNPNSIESKPPISVFEPIIKDKNLQFSPTDENTFLAPEPFFKFQSFGKGAVDAVLAPYAAVSSGIKSLYNSKLFGTTPVEENIR